MYVIVEIQGQQFKAEKDRFLYVHYLGEAVNEGDTVEFDRVLLADLDGTVKVGAPTVEGAKVVCTVEKSLVKGDKVSYSRRNASKAIVAKTVTVSTLPKLSSKTSKLNHSVSLLKNSRTHYGT